MSVGFQGDKGWKVQKNCEPFKFYKVPQRGHTLNDHPGTIIHDGDTLDVSSGSALVMLVDGKPHFTGVHEGSYPGGVSDEGEFDLYRRGNFGVDSNSFYEEFMAFRRKWGRR